MQEERRRRSRRRISGMKRREKKRRRKKVGAKEGQGAEKEEKGVEEVEQKEIKKG